MLSLTESAHAEQPTRLPQLHESTPRCSLYFLSCCKLSKTGCRSRKLSQQLPKFPNIFSEPRFCCTACDRNLFGEKTPHGRGQAGVFENMITQISTAVQNSDKTRVQQYTTSWARPPAPKTLRQLGRDLKCRNLDNAIITRNRMGTHSHSHSHMHT